MNSKLIKIILSMLMCAVTIFILHILLPSFPQLIIIMEIVMDMEIQALAAVILIHIILVDMVMAMQLY